jgi:hypothetical protein
MVTYRNRHWDELPNREAYYNKEVIRFELKEDRLMDKAPTLFIKLNGETGGLEKAWIGYVYGFKDEDDRVSFKVYVEKEVPLTDIPKRYLSLREGWYSEDERPQVPPEFSLYPPFLYSLLTTRKWRGLKNLTFQLLKLIGIHKLHKFKRRGKAS